MQVRMDLGAASVAVLGAGGFLGTSLCQFLAPRARRVVGLSRTVRSIPGVDWFTGQVEDDVLLRRALVGVDTVFYLANAFKPAETIENPVQDIVLNMASAVRAFETVARGSQARLVFVSSGGMVYGRQGEAPVREDDPTDPITPYGVSRLALEKYLHVFHERDGLDYRILRLGNPYGPTQTAQRGQGLVAAIIQCGLQNRALEVWGDVSTVRDYVYIDDVVELFARLVAYDGPTRTFNVGTGHGHSTRALIDLVGAALGREIAVAYKPGRWFDLDRNVLDVSRATVELGWTAQTRIADGIARTVSHLAGG